MKMEIACQIIVMSLISQALKIHVVAQILMLDLPETVVMKTLIVELTIIAETLRSSVLMVSPTLPVMTMEIVIQVNSVD